MICGVVFTPNPTNDACTQGDVLYSQTITSSINPSPTPTPSPTVTPTPTPAPTQIDYFASCDKSVETGLSCFSRVYSGTSKIAWVTNAAEDGTHSLQVTSPTSTTAVAGMNAKPGGVYPVNNATVPGVTFTGTAWVKASVVGEKLKLYLRERGTNNSSPGSASKSWTATDTNWHLLSVTYTTKGTNNSLTYSVYASSLASGRSFWADVFGLTSQ